MSSYVRSHLPNVTITAAESVAAGAAPAHCRVAAVLTPSSDSHIEMEAWLPESGWNGKFQAVGNGGWAGSISFDAMAAALREGYATASTDTGHKSAVTPGASFALDHPEKLIDFGYRAVHEMTVTAKALIAAYYGTAAKLAYWNSCSNGGRQGLMEAQRYPDDFDGIVAGAPAANWTGRALASLWVAQAVHKDEASYIPPAKYPLLNRAVLEACDALDGVRDGILGDPHALQVRSGSSALCRRGRSVVPHRAAGGGGAEDLHRARFLSGSGAGKRTGVGHLRRSAAVRHRQRLRQICLRRKSELGLSRTGRGVGGRAGGEGGPWNDQRAQSRSAGPSWRAAES